MKKKYKNDCHTHKLSFKNIFFLVCAFLAFMSVYFFFTDRRYMVSYIFYLVALFYLLGLPLSYVLHKKMEKFRCINCGECCKLKFELKKPDIMRFEKGKIGWEKFVDENWNIKRNNNYCSFIVDKKGKKICSIYEHRPDTCRVWPFFSNSFSISWIWFFYCPSLRKLIFKKDI